MAGLVLWLHVVALGIWLGGVVTVSFVVAPALFGALPAPQAGDVVARLFPGYYALGYGAGAVVVVSAAVLRRWARPAGGLWLAVTALAAVALAMWLYAGLVVHPRASALRAEARAAGAPPAVRTEFDTLHARAVTLNGAVLVAQLALAGLLAGALRAGVGGGRRGVERRW